MPQTIPFKDAYRYMLVLSQLAWLRTLNNGITRPATFPDNFPFRDRGSRGRDFLVQTFSKPQPYFYDSINKRIRVNTQLYPDIGLEDTNNVAIENFYSILNSTFVIPSINNLPFDERDEAAWPIYEYLISDYKNRPIAAETFKRKMEFSKNENMDPTLDPKQKYCIWEIEHMTGGQDTLGSDALYTKEGTLYNKLRFPAQKYLQDKYEIAQNFLKLFQKPLTSNDLKEITTSNDRTYSFGIGFLSIPRQALFFRNQKIMDMGKLEQGHSCIIVCADFEYY